MKRREFITLIGGAAVTWPVAAGAQQPVMPVIGFLASRSPVDSADVVAAFRKGLDESGFIEGQNVAIEYRWAQGRYDRLPALAADLVGWPVRVIAALGPPAAQAAKAATTSIPIVFTSGGDPVVMGLVASLNRPGGNVTGVNLYTGLLAAKRLALLRELIPSVGVIAVLRNPSNPETDAELREVQVAAGALKQEIIVLSAATEAEIEMAFADAVRRQAGALMVASDPFFLGRREQIVALAARHRVPSIYQFRAFVEAGGLVSYGTSLADAYKQAGLQVGRILKGEKPADLPVMQASKFEFMINLKTAKALGLDLPDKVLAVADEVIE
jgi:putative tryptophan/tyrosine transport system substrate-binding protein